MDATAFEVWVGGISGLSAAQRRQVLEMLAVPALEAVAEPVEALSAEAGAVDRVDRVADPVGVAGIAELGQRRVASLGCPHCGNRDVVRWGRASELPRYRCKACKRTFNALTRTPLARLRLKEEWAEQTQALIDGVSTAKAAGRCGVHYTTAFRWRHRFLASLAGDKPRVMTGIVEGDETFILESFKGRRSGAGARACRANRASEAANPPGAACPPNRSR